MIGNAIALNDGVIATGGQISLASITLNNSQNFDAPLANVGANITSGIDINDKRLNFSGPGTFLVPGLISGSGLVRRGSGDGVTILTANNSYTGNTEVGSGTLIVNGSQPQSTVVVITSGTLAGAGTVGNVVVVSTVAGGSASRINPGNVNNGTAILNTGSVINSTPLGIFEFDLKSTTAGSGYDQLNVTGGVNLGTQSPTLQINLSFLPSPGTSFTIINNDGSDAVLSNFAGLLEGANLTVNGITLVISYKGGDGNDVVLRVPQTKVWDGGGSTNNWSNAANWVGNVAPGFGDSLEFPASGGNSNILTFNDFAANTVFNSITLLGAGYSINGNGMTLNGGINETVASGFANVINAPIQLARSQSFVTAASGSRQLIIDSVNLGDKTLTLAGSGNCAIVGPISGTGSLTQASTGETLLNANNTYTGLTTINSGTLRVGGDQSSSPVNLNNGVLTDQGIVGPLVSQGGKVSPGPQAMTVSGNVILNQSTTVEIKTFGVGSSFFTRLNVNGTVNIGNSTLTVLPPPAPVITPTSLIVANDGSDPVVGTFAGLPEGAIITAGPHQFRISYVGGDGNDVVLVRVPVTRRWDGGSAVNSNWTTKENWEGDVVPIAGDNLEFPAGAARLTTSNDFVSGTLFNSITFSGAGYAHFGVGVSLNAGVNEVVTSGEDNRFQLPISLNASQSFLTAASNNRVLRFNSVVLGDKSLTLDGAGPCNILGDISGSGSITRRGTGLSVLSGANTYTGSTTVESGILRVDGAQPSSAVTVNNGTLEGGGTVGPLVATGGKVSPSGTSVTLTVAGNVTFNQAATLEIRRGSSLTALKANGTVNLGGSTLTILPSFSVPANTTSVIIDNDGSEPVNGTFAGLAEGALITTGTHQFQLSYIGGTGNDVTLTLLGSAAPTITSHPSNQSVLVGQPASFSVVATGSGTLTYQWQKNMVNIGGATGPTYDLAAAELIDNGAKFRCLVTNSFGTATSNEATLTVSGPPPVIITEENTDVAIALDSVTRIRGPFSLTNNHNLSSDQRTRVMFIIRNLDLLPGENMSAITARAEDAQLNQFPLTLEFIGNIPGFDFTQLVVRLPDNLPTGQTLLVSVTLRGQTSNKARISMR